MKNETQEEEVPIVSEALAPMIDAVPMMPIISLQQSLEAWDAFQHIVKERMREGYHFDTIPGTQKPSLLDPGGDLLMKMYGLSDVHPIDPHGKPSYVIEHMTEDWDREPPLFDYLVSCTLYNVRTGEAVRTGKASCNSWEDKYRWRETRRICPQCKAEAIIRGKEEFGGGWMCWRKKGGCGAKFPDGSQAIEGQRAGRVPNMDIANQKNTILQIAQKRAKLRAVRSGTLAGEMFTQDIDETGVVKDSFDKKEFEAMKQKKVEDAKKRIAELEKKPATTTQPAKLETPKVSDHAEPALGTVQTEKFIVSDVVKRFIPQKDKTTGKIDNRKKKTEMLQVDSGNWRGLCFDKQYFGVLQSSKNKQIEVTVERTAGEFSAVWKITAVNAAWNGGQQEPEPKPAASDGPTLEEWFADKGGTKPEYSKDEAEAILNLSEKAPAR